LRWRGLLLDYWLRVWFAGCFRVPHLVAVTRITLVATYAGYFVPPPTFIAAIQHRALLVAVALLVISALAVHHTTAVSQLWTLIAVCRALAWFTTGYVGLHWIQLLVVAPSGCAAVDCRITRLDCRLADYCRLPVYVIAGWQFTVIGFSCVQLPPLLDCFPFSCRSGCYARCFIADVGCPAPGCPCTFGLLHAACYWLLVARASCHWLRLIALMVVAVNRCLQLHAGLLPVRVMKACRALPVCENGESGLRFVTVLPFARGYAVVPRGSHGWFPFT